METKEANGSYNCFGYDFLGRLLGVGAPGTCKGFVYDTVTTPPAGVTVRNPLGHMVEAYTNSNCDGHASIVTDEWFSYDADGRLTDLWESTPHSGGYFHTTVGYFANGLPSSLSGVPGVPTLMYGVDGDGHWSTAVQGSATIIGGVTYGPVGPTYVDIGAGTDQDVYTYDPATGRMNQYQFFVGSANTKGVLGWSANGSLKSLTITDGLDSGGSQTCTFTYDDITRLSGDSCPGVWSQTFSYDQYDNLTQAGSSSWNPGYNTKNQYSSIGATYDPSGNLTYDGSSVHYTWDSYGKMSSSGSTTVTYDAFGRAVETTVGSTYTEIVYSPLGKIGTGGQSFDTGYCIRTSSRRRSVFSPNPTANYVFHKDWLDSSRVGSSVPATGNGTMAYDRAFAPYGEVYANYNLPDHRCSREIRLVLVTGLYDTPNRELAQNQGRWMSPDPAGQGWNLYAYPTDPNRFTDPSGLDCVSSIDGHVVEGDCEGKDPNNEYYVNCDGCLNGVQFTRAENGALVGLDSNGNAVAAFDDNGDLRAEVNGSVGCSGDCPSVSVTVNGGSALLLGTTTSSIPNNATIGPLKGQKYLDALNAYCSARGRAKFIADWLPGGGTIAKNLWNSSTGAALSFYQLPAADINRITEDNSGAQTIAIHATSEGLKAAQASTAFLYALRAQTGIPMTVGSKILGTAATAALVIDAGIGFVKEGKEILNCQAGR